MIASFNSCRADADIKGRARTVPYIYPWLLHTCVLYAFNACGARSWGRNCVEVQVSRGYSPPNLNSTNTFFAASERSTLANTPWKAHYKKTSKKLKMHGCATSIGRLHGLGMSTLLFVGSAQACQRICSCGCETTSQSRLFQHIVSGGRPGQHMPVVGWDYMASHATAVNVVSKVWSKTTAMVLSLCLAPCNPTRCIISSYSSINVAPPLQSVEKNWTPTCMGLESRAGPCVCFCIAGHTRLLPYCNCKRLPGFHACVHHLYLRDEFLGVHECIGVKSVSYHLLLG